MVPDILSAVEEKGAWAQ